MPTRGKKLTLLLATLAVVVLGVATWQAWPHIVFRWRFERLEKNTKGLPEYRHRQTGIIFVRVPGGTFWMGSPESEGGRLSSEGPMHEVTLSPFLIAACEVTQAQWKRVMGSNASEFKGDDLPVETVSWDDCQEFCRKTGLKLPTEAEWEYSCRAGTSGPFAGTGKLDAMAWYEENSGGRSHPVGRKLPNGFGLHDMHGNVFEWCEDWYQEDFYAESAGVTDPLCTNPGSEYRVLRGGCWFILARYCRSASRNRSIPWFRQYLGLRPSVSSP